MAWNSHLRPFVYGPEDSFNLLYDLSYNPYQGMEVKHAGISEATNGLVPKIDKMNYGSKEKKKRLTNDQVESLERSFNEEIKLDPDTKKKLSRELGLQPKQIAVWFQNRRARLKAKQLEHLYGALKQEYDNVSQEKQKLQEEVMKLKAVLREQATRMQASTSYSEISAGETMETTSVAAIRSSNLAQEPTGHHQVVECNYLLSKDEYNPVSSSYWAVLPSYP